MSNAGGWRPHIESALTLDLGRLFNTGALRMNATTSGSWHWHRDGERVASVGYTSTLGTDTGELRLAYTWNRDGESQDATCVVRLTSLPLNYGGRRWYMHCPYTGQRALKLYKFGGIELFCARTAIRPLPTYASQRSSGASRIIEQRWAIRRKLGDNFSDLFGEPFKPKRMHWRTFERHAARDAQLADAEYGHMRRLLDRLQRMD